MASDSPDRTSVARQPASDAANTLTREAQVQALRAEIERLGGIKILRKYSAFHATWWDQLLTRIAELGVDSHRPGHHCDPAEETSCRL